MSVHRYRRDALAADGARALAGLAATAGPLALVETSAPIAVLLGVLAALFAAYGVRTAARIPQRIEVDEAAIAATGLRSAQLRWVDLSSMKLNYYSTKRDGRGGWMQLKLNAGGRTLRIESTLEGFPDVVSRAAGAADRRGIALPPATTANLSLLGIRAGRGRPA